jgi:S-formylglutathione hydrolase FrmB
MCAGVNPNNPFRVFAKPFAFAIIPAREFSQHILAPQKQGLDMRFPWSILFVLVTMTSGCSVLTNKIAPTNTPSFTPVAIATSTIAPTKAANPNVPLPSSTPHPTSTTTFTPTPSSTPTRTNTPTRTATSTTTFTPTPYPVPSGNINRIDATFRSASLGLDREVIIYLPPGYSVTTQRRYPVLYLLHGWGGFDLKHTTEWEQAGLMNEVQTLIVQGKMQPMIIVQPLSYLPTPPNECSMYFNHGAGTDGKPWADYIWKDVVNYIDTNYRTIARRESRAIGGFSFGGQGAFSLSLTHPEVFKVVGGHSPSFREADGSIGFMSDPEWYNQFDPVWLVKNKTTASQLSIWMDVATGDDKVRECGPGSDHCLEAFHDLLASKGIAHEWHDQWAGPHELSYWESHVPDYMAWYSSQLVGQ